MVQIVSSTLLHYKKMSCPLREKCPNAELFLVQIQENTEQK